MCRAGCEGVQGVQVHGQGVRLRQGEAGGAGLGRVCRVCRMRQGVQAQVQGAPSSTCYA